MRPIEPIVQKLARAQTRLLRAADAVSAEQWKRGPGNGTWSAGELVAHLIMVERGIVGTADRVTQKPAKPASFLKRLHLPLALVESRLVRRKTPIPLDPQLVREKEAMLGELRDVRERSLAFLDETKNRNLSAYCWRHPFLGNLNLYEWFEMIAAHELRHTKQMQEIAAALPKTVETLQK
ncbi:MAG: DinB family protein [Candidatus Acidiferrales bacterium]